MLIRILAAALVAIIITAGIAIGLGNVPEVEAQEPTISGGYAVKTDVWNCSYHLPVDSILPDGDTTDGMDYRLVHAQGSHQRTVYYRQFQDHGNIEIGPYRTAWIRSRTNDYGRDTYSHRMPTRTEAEDGLWAWQLTYPKLPHERHARRLGSWFVGPYAEDLHQALLECATPPTPTPTPTPEATATPEPTATPTSSPTPTATMPPLAPINPPLAPTPTPRPEPSRPTTTPTATSPPSPTPEATATPVSGGAGGNSDDDADLAEILDQLAGLLSELVKYLNSR